MMQRLRRAEQLVAAVRAGRSGGERGEAGARVQRVEPRVEQLAVGRRAEAEQRRGAFADDLGVARAEPTAVVAAVAARSSRPAAEVGALLYGAAPADDASLVRLADALDDLEREVRRP